MASLQSYNPDQTYYQGQYRSNYPSLVNSETERTSKTQTYYTESELAKGQTAQWYSQTETSDPNYSHTQKHHGLGLGGLGHGHGLTRTHGSSHGHGHGHGLTETYAYSQAGAGSNRTHKKRGEHKRGLFQKLKDGISGGDDSSSSSDSENEGEKRETIVIRQQNF